MSDRAADDEIPGSLGSDPTLDETADVSDDPRVLAAIQEYMAAVEAGRRPNRRELLARHPDIATELSACLQGLALIQGAAAEIGRDAGESRRETDPPEVAEELTSAQPLGDFRLLREVGRGGMGVVYEAVQLSLGRRVALKVLPLAGALDPRQLQRFRNEAQAAAQLHHTNIVPVYAVGCERSVHFYAMQFIDGQSLAQVISELRKASGRDGAKTVVATQGSSAGAKGITLTEAERDEHWHSIARASKTSALPRPTENLSVLFSAKRHSFFGTVARLGMQAAEALDYAHQYGVIHRDIKPANLMLDVHGTLWITDFGLAQLVSGDAAAGAGLTQPGDMLGTLRYMSPEQSNRKAAVLDQRTDVYSLGVTLYELLTLERALSGETREQLLYQIDYVDPKPARSIDRAIPIELETILNKAMAKDAGERYPTARAMADDLRRFLANEPILARPPSLWDKSVKWTRRHKAIAVSTILTLLITTVLAIVSAVLIARRAQEARAQRDRADHSLEQARQAVDYFTVAAEELPKDGQFLRYRQGFLERALTYYQNFLTERGNDPKIEAQLVAARERIEALLTEVKLVDELFRLFVCKELITKADVQDDLERSHLKLTDDQARALAALAESDRAKRLQENRGATSRPVPAFERPAEERPQILREDIDATTKQLKFLTGDQFERLQQISRQVRGVAAFSDYDVSKLLGLNATQLKRVQELQEETRRPRAKPGGKAGGMRGAPPDAERGRRGGSERGVQVFEEMRQAREAAVAQVVQMLTPQQRAAWQSLTGAPFTGRVSLFGGFLGGGFGPGGGAGAGAGGAGSPPHDHDRGDRGDRDDRRGGPDDAPPAPSPPSPPPAPDEPR
jgi:serine/threonine protein kinase